MADREERIRKRAYELWQREGEPHGRDQDYWHRAVAELGLDDVGEVEIPVPAAEDLKPKKPRPARKPRGAAGQMVDMAESFAPDNLDQAIEEANASVHEAAGKPARKPAAQPAGAPAARKTTRAPKAK